MIQVPHNPLTLVYAELWRMLRRHKQFDQLVRPGNVISFGDDGHPVNPVKSRVLAADMPEIMLTTDGGSYNMQSTSTTSRITRRYTWVVSTGDEKVSPTLYPIEWMIATAMLDWCERLGALRWPLVTGDPFVKRASTSDIAEGRRITTDPTRPGWAVLWRLEVEMHFKTSVLKSELSEG